MATIADYLLENVGTDEMHEFARNSYTSVAHDLPEFGKGHYQAAHEHVALALHDKFHNKNPTTNFGSVARKALRGVVDDDRVESRQYFRKSNKRKIDPQKVFSNEW